MSKDAADGFDDFREHASESANRSPCRSAPPQVWGLRMTALHSLSARALLSGLQQGDWSSEELTQHYLDRIAEQNPRLHAIHFLLPHAMAQARESDQRRARGETMGPLAGLPMTLKDAFALKGERTTFGSYVYARFHSRRQPRLLQALQDSGVILIGRSAVPTLAFDWNCRNQVFAECLNPHDLSRSPGGSSGGAAAALASGMTPLELGSDLGGSIRYPAHCCGVYGLRTSEGWLPFGDVGPRAKASFRNLAVAGPMANHLGDLGLMLDLFAQVFPDQRLQTQHDRPLRKVAFSKSLAGLSADAETQRLLDICLAKLATQGLELVEHQPPLDFAQLNADWGLVVGYELAQNLPALMPRWLKQEALDRVLFQKIGPGWMRDGLLDGVALNHSQYLAALAMVRSLQNKMDLFFKDYDAWILPVSPSPARLLSESGQWMQTHQGKMTYTDFVGSYLCATTLLGTPALTLPIGNTTAGLPVVIQMHGPRFGDLWLYQKALALFEA